MPPSTSSTVIEKIPVGISSCLLGEEVRFDGGHKQDRYITDTLGKFFEFQAFCPETAIGLGIPRQAIRLVREGEEVRAKGSRTSELDVTGALNALVPDATEQYVGLCGYILKKGSPSCGMARVRVYNDSVPQRRGIGLFARSLMETFPTLPIEEEGRLCDPVIRENFVLRVFVRHRWQQMLKQGLSSPALVDFHTRHKFVILAHHTERYRSLGRLVSDLKSQPLEDIADQYLALLMETLAIKATRGRHINVLTHMQGFLKTSLDGGDKHELSEIMEKYRHGQVPLVVPVSLLKHHFRKFPNTYISESLYLDPYPESLALRNEL